MTETEESTKGQRRERSPEDEEEGYVVVCKKKHKIKENMERESRAALQQRPELTVTKPGTSKDQTKPVIIRFLDSNFSASNPVAMTEMINKSPFAKYVVQYSVRTLGNGTGCRLEISDPNNKCVNPEQVEYIAGKKVRCWHPSEATTFGKIGPISTDLTAEEIMGMIEIIEGRPNTIVSVQRVRTTKGEPKEEIIIGAKEEMPIRVGIANCFFWVHSYQKPP